jgi:hypothetical protein
MNASALLKNLGDILVQLLMLVIYIPKTLFKILKDPAWVPSYIAEENKKDPAYRDYVAPLLLYICLALVPYALVPTGLFTFQTINKILGILQTSDAFMVGAIFIAIPLTFTFLIELFTAGSFSRSSMEYYLYIQFYFFAPFVLAVQMRYVLEILLSTFCHPLMYLYVVFVLVPVIVWLFFVQLNILIKEFSGSVIKAISVLILGILLIFIVTDSIGFKFSASWSLGKWELGAILALSMVAFYGVALVMRLMSWRRGNKKDKREDAS